MINASILDLRYKMKDVLKALHRNERVKILYHGQPCGLLVPWKTQSKTKRVAEHPFFGMDSTPTLSVDEMMEQLRGGRHSAVLYRYFDLDTAWADESCTAY